MRSEESSTLGDRLRHIRASRSQAEVAQQLGVALRTYANYERDERVPDAAVLRLLVEKGWNANWLLTGEGPERLDALQPLSSKVSQAVRQQELTLAVQLAEEALDGGTLEPGDYAHLVALIYDALVNGLPSAQVLALARPAARGLGQGGSTGDGRPEMGRTGKGATGKGKTAA